jgi:ribosomal protein L11 methyltransferase
MSLSLPFGASGARRSGVWISLSADLSDRSALGVKPERPESKGEIVEATTAARSRRYHQAVMLDRYGHGGAGCVVDYEPFTVGARLLIAPPGAPRPADGRVGLAIARGAFGSGEHETTASCLELLDALDLAGAQVLDLGAGTGILAVAALALGAARAMLVDRDPRAAACARRHLELNRLADRALVIAGELAALADEPRFDVVLANLHGDILVPLAPELVRRARPRARRVLSGILWEHSWDVRERFEGLGCEVELNRFLEEYCTLLLRAGG